MKMIIRYVLCVIVTVSSSFVGANSVMSRETARDSYDPYIICEGMGPTHAEGLPRAYSEDSYRLNLYLCSATHGIPRHNVGCACTRAMGNVRCSQDVADPVLWSAEYTSLNQLEIDEAIDRGFRDGKKPFADYCWDNCLCVDPSTARRSNNNNSIALSVLHRYRVGELARQRAGTIDFDPFTGGAVVTGPEIGNVQGDPAIHTQCGNNCTSNDDCKGPISSTGTGDSGSGSNCTCRAAQSSQYQPGAGAVAFVAACLINMATGGKRGEQMPCPCNSTYVSHGCCEAKDGWIWEAPEHKLGELTS